MELNNATKPKRPTKKWEDMNHAEKVGGLIGLVVVVLVIIWVISAIVGAATSKSTNNSTNKPIPINTSGSNFSAPSTDSTTTPTNDSTQTTQKQAAQSTKPNPPTITGYGALQDDWNANHQQDPNYAANEVYNPTPGLGLGLDSDHTDKYYALTTSDNRVTGYEMRLPNDYRLAASQQEVMQEFPSDTTKLWQRTVTGQCSQMEIQSKTLGTVLSTPDLGDSQGEVLIEFQTDTKDTESLNSYYDPSNVNLATLTFAIYNTVQGAPDC